RARPWRWCCTTPTSPPATPITSLPCAGAGRCIRVPRRRSSATRCCAPSTRWISAYTRSTGSGSACTFEWAEAGRRAPGPGANGCGGSHRGGAPTAGRDILVSSVLVGAPAPGANGAGGFRTEAVLLQQIPISSLALSLQEHPPQVRMDVAVHTEAVLLQKIPISSLSLTLQEHPPRVRMDVAVHTEAGLLQQIPISS